MDVKFTFKMSPSKNFNDVIKLSRKLGDLNQEGDLYTIIMSNEKIHLNWDLFNKLFHLIKQWRSFDLYINNESILDYKEKTSIFYNIQNIHSCYKHYRKVMNRTQHCDSSCWKCIQLRNVGFNSMGVNWYNFGHFESETLWMIHKDEVRDVLLGEANVKCTGVCPLFSFENVETAINDLPTEIYIDNNWEVLYKQCVIGGICEDIPFNIKYIPKKLRTPEERISSIVMQMEKLIIEYNTIKSSLIKPVSEDERSNRLIDEWIKNNKR